MSVGWGRERSAKIDKVSHARGMPTAQLTARTPETDLCRAMRASLYASIDLFSMVATTFGGKHCSASVKSRGLRSGAPCWLPLSGKVIAFCRTVPVCQKRVHSHT